MKSLLIVISLFLGVANAGDRSRAYNVVCKPMTFDSQRNECISKIKPFNYFDNIALQVCASIQFDSNKISCLGVIGNKSYEVYEADSCLRQPFELSKMQCLEEMGSPYDPSKPVCVSNEEAIAQISNSLIDLRRGNLAVVDQRLVNLLDRYSSCSK